MFSSIPITKSPIILSKFFNRNGLLGDKESGIAIPIINKNDGNIKSAIVSPFQLGCFSHQGRLSIKLSTMHMPTIVKPRKTSSDSNLCFCFGYEIGDNED